MKKILLLLSLFSFNVFATPVDINTADAKTISEALNGIGLKKAEAIVKYRTEKGAFKSFQDLDNVPGISAKTIKNKEDILFTDTTVKPATVSPTPAK